MIVILMMRGFNWLRCVHSAEAWNTSVANLGRSLGASGKLGRWRIWRRLGIGQSLGLAWPLGRARQASRLGTTTQYYILCIWAVTGSARMQTRPESGTGGWSDLTGPEGGSELGWLGDLG